MLMAPNSGKLDQTATGIRRQLGTPTRRRVGNPLLVTIPNIGARSNDIRIVP
jgi:hypothetical protein